MNILVTGGAGFIGSRMAARHLADGHKVVVVDNLSTGSREKVPEGARLVEADVAETDLEPLLRVGEDRSRFPRTPRRSTCAIASRIPSSTRAPTSLDP